MSTDGQRVNVRDGAIELAQYLKAEPNEIDRAEYNIGQAYLAIYINEDFNTRSEAIRKLIAESILLTIVDLSVGGSQLRAGQIGVQFYENKQEVFVATHEMPPLGTMIFRVGIKHLIAFQGWRTKEAEEIPQLQTNCSIYYLICLLGQFLD